MDPQKAQILLDYIDADNKEKVLKGLREIKKRIVLSANNLQIFRKLNVTTSLTTLIQHQDEEIIKASLSVLSLCLNDGQMREKVHSSNALEHILNILQMESSEELQLRSCRVIGLLSLDASDTDEFHTLVVVPVIQFLKSCDSEEAKISGIKAIRYLGSTKNCSMMILEEKGIETVCTVGFSGGSSNLSKETVKTLTHFLKISHPMLFEQMLNGTNLFKTMVPEYDKLDGESSIDILEIFIEIIFFSVNGNGDNVALRYKLVEHLFYEKIVYVMVSELKKRNRLNIPAFPRLTLALCRLCETNSYWKGAIERILHEKIWFHLTECDGVSLLVTLLSYYENDSLYLPFILKGLLGVEILISHKVMVLKKFLTSRLVPILEGILTKGLEQMEDRCQMNSSSQCYSCGHLRMSSYPDKRKYYQEFDTNRKRKKAKPQRSLQVEITGESKLSNTPSTSENNENSSSIDTPISGSFSFSNKNTPSPPSEKEINQNSLPSLDLSQSEVESELDKSVCSNEKVSDTINQEEKQNRYQYWLLLLESIFRLLYQINSIKEYVPITCRKFFPMLCEYLGKSQYIHASSVNIITAVAKETSSIQPLLDTYFIPFLSVELRKLSNDRDCPQCSEINKGVNTVLVNLTQFFTHRHQYGRSEVALRLQPSKSQEIRQKCLLSIPHIMSCPRLLNSVLQQHNSLTELINILEGSFDTDSTHSYAIAALIGIMLNLSHEYGKKKKHICLYCVSTFEAIYGESRLSEEDRTQLLVLTSSNYTSDTPLNSCKWESVTEKDVFLRSGEKEIGAHREFLVDKCEVLRAMLSGYFSESESNIIDIDIDAQCLEMMIHFLYGCRCKYFHNASSEVYMELIFVAEMYFLPNLRVLAAHFLCQSISSSDEKYAVLEKLLTILEEPTLLEHILCAFMTKSHDWHSGTEWLTSLLNSDFKNRIMKVLDKGMNRLLKVASGSCTCQVPLRIQPADASQLAAYAIVDMY